MSSCNLPRTQSTSMHAHTLFCTPSLTHIHTHTRTLHCPNASIYSFSFAITSFCPLCRISGLWGHGLLGHPYDGYGGLERFFSNQCRISTGSHVQPADPARTQRFPDNVHPYADHHYASTSFFTSALPQLRWPTG